MRRWIRSPLPLQPVEDAQQCLIVNNILGALGAVFWDKHEKVEALAVGLIRVREVGAAGRTLARGPGSAADPFPERGWAITSYGQEAGVSCKMQQR